MKRQHSGYTLMELLVTVAIVGILTAVAVPSYRQYTLRAKRTDATTALLRLAAMQERFYIQNNTYASADLMDDAPPAGLGIAGTERGYYALDIQSNDLTTGYTATATVDAGGEQADDSDCATFSVTAQGLRSATDSGGADNTDRCWR
ncbi:MAG: prepilin-type N-terminal cleavage/methylation domain-containing protein [Gammaproteobacteria bacterium]|nr:prepilin-type N-terminal cleavage/methylation domain-containing protein [Gammaproteobacteria bacterium]QOJ31905.1 MAG: prepilin-type N-terminal cleavage/methylation domain-containing protein [Gammaproteobacteria bacterium]